MSEFKAGDEVIYTGIDYPAQGWYGGRTYILDRPVTSLGSDGPGWYVKGCDTWSFDTEFTLADSDDVLTALRKAVFEARRAGHEVDITVTKTVKQKETY